MQQFPSFVSDHEDKWLGAIQKPLDRISSIEDELEELPIEKERLRQELDRQGFFELSKLKKQLHLIAEMPAGTFNALVTKLDRNALDDIINLMIEARNPKPKKEEVSTGFMTLTFDELIEDFDEDDTDPGFRLDSLVRVKLEALYPLANKYFAINGQRFDGLRAEKAKLEKRLHHPHPKPRTPEIISRR